MNPGSYHRKNHIKPGNSALIFPACITHALSGPFFASSWFASAAMCNYPQPSAIDPAPVPERKFQRESVLDVLQFLTHYFPTQQAWLLFSLDSDVTLDAVNFVLPKRLNNFVLSLEYVFFWGSCTAWKRSNVIFRGRRNTFIRKSIDCDMCGIW